MSRLHAALTSCIVSTFQYEALLKIIFLCRLRLNTLLLLIRIHFTFRSAAVLDPRGHLAPPLLHPLLIHSVKCYSSSAPPVSQFQKSQLLLFFFYKLKYKATSCLNSDWPVKVHSSVALFVWRGPTLPEAGQSLDREIHRSRRSDRCGLWLYRQHHGKPADRKTKKGLSIKLVLLTNQQSKTQRLFIYCHEWWRKAVDHHI